MEHSGSEPLANHVTIDNETTREFTRPEMAKLAVYLAFEDTMTSADERLITREEAISYMQTLAPVILQRGTA